MHTPAKKSTDPHYNKWLFLYISGQILSPIFIRKGLSSYRVDRYSDKMSPDKMSLDQKSPDKMSQDKMSLDKKSPDKKTPDKMFQNKKSLNKN